MQYLSMNVFWDIAPYSLKCRQTSNRLHNSSQTTVIFILAAVKTWDLTKRNICYTYVTHLYYTTTDIISADWTHERSPICYVFLACTTFIVFVYGTHRTLLCSGYHFCFIYGWFRVRKLDGRPAMFPNVCCFSLALQENFGTVSKSRS